MYCSNCGKLLQDGEICDCQKQGTPVTQPQINVASIAEAAPIEPASPIADSFNQAVAEADATIAGAAAKADATINGTAASSNQQVNVSSAAAGVAAGMAAAQNANERANQYYQQYAPQNQSQPYQQAPNQFNQGSNGQPQNTQPQFGQSAQNNNQYGFVQNNQYGQPSQYQNQYNQAQNTQYNQPQGQYGQPQYNQPQGQYGQSQYRQYNGANQFQTPPPYYNQPTYMSEDERLMKYMSSPKFVAARDVMCSTPVLMYAISVSALLVFFIVTMQSVLDLFHPLYILLCIGAWITFSSALKSKKNNTLPSTTGLSIGSGVAITMLVIWCIAIGATLLLLIIASVSVLSYGASTADRGVLALFIMLAVTILILVLGIKYYSLQSRNLKYIKFCITNEANPGRFSVFPAVLLIITIILSIIGLVGMQSILGSSRLKVLITDYLLDYFKSLDKMNIGMSSREMTNYILDMIYSKKGQILNIISTALGCLTMLSTAFLYIRAKSKLSDFTEL